MRLLPTAALLLALPLLSQQKPIPDPSFTEVIDVDVVNVEVYVTDRDGRHVQGLSRGDFQLLVDGHPMEIVNFSEVAEGAPVPVKAPSAVAPPAAEPGQAAAPPAGPEPLSLVVYVDNDNLRPFSRNRALRQLRSFLDENLGPRDRIMLVTHEGGLKVRRPLSAGGESLAADLTKIERTTANGVLQDSRARQALGTIRELCTGVQDRTGEKEPGEAERVARLYAMEVSNDVKVSLNALQSVVESLSGIEGRKAVLYVSDGVALHPGEEAFGLLEELCGIPARFQTEDVSARLRKLTTLANTSSVTFYTVEAAGVRNGSSASAETAQPMLSANLDFAQVADSQQVLFNLASETGGRAVLNANEFKTDLARIASDLRSYYSLGYSPVRSGDDRVHRVEVKVTREGLRARHRTTYRNLPREERLAARVQTALLHGIVDNPLQARLAIVSSEPAERRSRLVTLRIALPLRQLVLLSQGDSWTGQLTLWLGVRDEAGRMAPVQSVRVPVRIPATQVKDPLERPFVYDIRMRMARRGEQTVAVGIQDDLGHTTSFLRETFRVDPKGVTAASSER